jgi:hypothetical protein
MVGGASWRPTSRKERDMRRRASVASLAALSVLLVTAAASSTPGHVATAAAKPVRLDEATMIVEVNATDGDAGLQVFLDAEPWNSMTITAPDGRRMLDINGTGRLKNYGLTELFSESSEPPFSEFPLKRFKRLWPEGRYSFVGTTIEGRRLVGKARLSHDIPDGPQIISPTDGSTVAPGTVVVARWNPVPEPEGINVVGYRALVEREDPLRVFSVDLPASVTSVTVPPEFLEASTDYKVEVQAIEASGNQTLTEIGFRVS